MVRLTSVINGLGFGRQCASVEYERRHEMKATKRHAPKGYVAVRRPDAKALFDAGQEVVVAGNNVNSYHVFNGWVLSFVLRAGQPFETQIDSFMFYLEPELGKYPVFYVKADVLAG